VNAPAPDFRRGYLRIPHAVWTAVYCRAPLSRRQLQLVSVVLRESWGWSDGQGYVNLWTRPLPTRAFADATGLNTDHIRRDLLELVLREVLLQDGERYRFVPDVRLWKRLEPPPPKEMGGAPEHPPSSAGVASSTPVLKKPNTEERNVPGARESGSSTAGDNSEPPSLASLAPRLADVVTAFVGALPPATAEALRRWICEDGIATVWQSLEPSLRQDPLTARHELERLLAQRALDRKEGSAGQEGAGDAQL